MKLPTAAAWLLATMIVSSASVPTTAHGEEKETNSDDSCGLYLAVSSTSTVDEPKWGIYAGKEIDKDDLIGYGDLAVQTFHLLANAVGEEEDNDVDESLAEVVEWFEQYIWVPQSSGGQFELEDGGRIVTAVGGAGVLGGYNPKLTNSDWNHSVAYHREAWNEEVGVAHPGRGAYTNYFDVGLSATQDIKVGAEIFVNYGDNWEEDEDEEDEERQNKITKEDHEKIDQTIQKMIGFFEKHKAELDEASKMEIYQFLIRDVMAAAAGGKKGAKITEMLPDNPDQLQEVLDNGGSLALSAPTAIRSIEWLEAHGRCMDNIRPGPSTIPHAGRGAMATRAMKEGSLVAPVPLVQIADEAILEMYPVKMLIDEEDEEYFVRDIPADGEQEPIGTQLLVNYCFGHPDSSLIFFPAGASTGFINHSKEPNAKLVWSDHPNHNKHWYDMEPMSLIEEGQMHLGLLLEVVATKDIAEGEEVFIDYGDEWAAAWEEHVANWKSLQESGDIPTEWPTRALDLNQEYKTKPHEIEASHPDNVKRMCFLMVKKPDDEPPVNENGDKVRVWVQGGAKSTITGENLFDCKIIASNAAEVEDGDNWSYTIAWSNGAQETTIVKNVPHEAVVFVDNPGSSDQHTLYGFRHYIGIPDDIFPEGPWRNVGDDDGEDDDEEEEE